MNLRKMTIDDYEVVYNLWTQIPGFGIRTVDDSREGVERFLNRNPNTSVVAEDDTGIIVGCILCGHDGRTGCLYHVCVKEEFRRRGIGKAMVGFTMNALKDEKVSKITLIAFKKNDGGNAFWRGIGWTRRADVNTFDFVLNDDNITKFVK